MKYTEKFSSLKTEKENNWKSFYIFNTVARNIDCRYTLGPHRRGGSNEYLQSMFWNKFQFCYIKVWYEGVYFSFS